MHKPEDKKESNGVPQEMGTLSTKYYRIQVKMAILACARASQKKKRKKDANIDDMKAEYKKMEYPEQYHIWPRRANKRRLSALGDRTFLEFCGTAKHK